MSNPNSSHDQTEIDLGDQSSRISIDDPPQIINQTQQGPAPRSNFVFSDSIHNVLRGFMPLVDHGGVGHMSHGSLSRIHNITPSTLRNFIAAQQNVAVGETQNTTINLGPGSQTYGTSSDGRADGSFTQQSSTNERSGDVVSTPPTSNAQQDRDPNSRYREQLFQTPEYIQLRNTCIRYSPFYLILLLKFVYDHRQGLITFATLFITFSYSNNVVKEELGKQTNRSVPTLLTQLMCTIACIVIITLLFDQGALLNNLTFAMGYADPFDMWNLLWLVCLTDFVLKLITVDFKIIITSLPAKLLPFKSRGKIYLFIEATSQLYRSIIPIQPWLFYLTEMYGSSDKNMGMFLSVGYLICKGIDVISRLKFFKHAFGKLLLSVNLGMKPSSEQLLSAGEYCPICQDNYVVPVRLKCGHIFCEGCVAVWLDREHTCPLCRANVSDDPSWRDGSTTHFIQIY